MKSSSIYIDMAAPRGPLPLPSAPAQNTPSAADVVYNSLKAAAKTLDVQLTRDQKFPELADTLTSSYSGDYTSPPSPERDPITKKRTINLPDALFEQYDLLQCRCFMGLFPEINRAWITVDHRLFLWNYMDGSDFYSFEDQDQVIVSVGLVKPKPGIFIDQIQYLLVIATPLEVIILGMSLNDSTATSINRGSAQSVGDLVLYTTQMSVPSDNVSMTCVVGSDNGRIFMCGNDGHLYELMYQAEEGWFTRKVRKLNHTSSPYSTLLPTFLKYFSQEDPIISIACDESRNVLYTLSQKSNIEIIYLGIDGSGFTKVAKHTEVVKYAQIACPNSPLLDVRTFQITSIHPILATESRLVHLAAVTTTGCRLYFSHFKNALRGYPTTYPSALELIHVRVPEIQQLLNRDISVYSRNSASTNVHVSCYSNGTFLAANGISEDLDTLFAAVPNTGKMLHQIDKNERPSLSELASTVKIEGKTWAIAEYIDPNYTTKSLPKYLRADDKEIALNELATQFARPPRQFLVLTNSGINVLAKERPIDILLHLFEVGASDGALAQFSETYGAVQTCAMYLGIACNNPFVHSFFTPRLGISHIRDADSNIVWRALHAFFVTGGYPKVKPQNYSSGATNDLGRPMSSVEIDFSAKHDGFVLYFARLIRPIWKYKVTKLSPSHANPHRQELNIPSFLLISVQRDLSDLKNFLDRHPELTSIPDPSDPRSRNIDGALQSEAQSFSHIRDLLIQSIEAISFILLLNDYKLPDIINSISEASQKDLLDLTYENLLTSSKGRQLCQDMVTALINRQIGQQINVDAVSEMLQRKCQSFFTANDVILYKATENLKRATEAVDRQESFSALEESLRLFKIIAGHLSNGRLREICEDYKILGFHRGAVELALLCAQEQDPTGLAKSFIEEDSPASDPRAEFFEKRKQCYECVFAAWKDANALVARSKTSSASQLEAENFRGEVIKQALSSNDVLFHHMLYDWLISEGLIDQLLQANTDYLEVYLRREPLTLERGEILSRFYMLRQQNDKAARILAKIAESTDYEIPLERRLEWLSLAVTNAKSYGQTGEASSLQELEEKLEVAQVQLNIYYAIKNLGGGYEQFQEELNRGLLAITELYRDFANHLNLYEEILEIFHVSDYKDQQLLESKWKSLLASVIESENRHGRIPHKAVAEKVKEIGRRFHLSETVFPLNLIVLLLEKYACENMDTLERSWVGKTLLDINVPFDIFFDVLNDIFEAKPSPFQDPDALALLIYDIEYLEEKWLEHILKPTASVLERANFPVRIINESIRKCLNSLSPVEVELIEKLKMLERRIQETQHELAHSSSIYT